MKLRINCAIEIDVDDVIFDDEEFGPEQLKEMDDSEVRSLLLGMFPESNKLIEERLELVSVQLINGLKEEGYVDLQ